MPLRTIRLCCLRFDPVALNALFAGFAPPPPCPEKLLAPQEGQAAKLYMAVALLLRFHDISGGFNQSCIQGTLHNLGTNWLITSRIAQKITLSNHESL